MKNQKIYPLIAIILLSLILTACEKEILYQNLSEKEANKVISLLLPNNIEAEKKISKDGSTILVNKEEMAEAISIIQASGLQDDDQEEVFGCEEKTFPTPLEDRSCYIYSLSKSLELTLMQLDYVTKARVHVVLPERIAPGQPIQPSSAAVLIKHQSGLDPDIMRSKLHSLISKSIPGLATLHDNKISVVFIESSVVPTKISWKKVGPFMVQKNSSALLKTLLISLISLCILLFTTQLITLFRPNIFSKLYISNSIKSN